MKFTIQKEELLKPLQALAGVVERRQTLPILANVLIKADANQITLLGTDLETELTTCASGTVAEAGAITVSARKLIDICRNLPEKSLLEVSEQAHKMIVRVGKSRFSLATLPANDFPVIEQQNARLAFDISQQDLQFLLIRTQFAMAQQDVRYYLNGLLLQINTQQIRAVATDGHRLAMAFSDNAKAPENLQVIVPRKAVSELLRLLQQTEAKIQIAIGSTYFQVQTAEFKFSSKLIDGRFPDYDKVLPKNCDKIIHIDKETLRQALMRVSVLSHEKSRGVRIQLRENLLRVLAQNHEQEEAEEELNIDYTGTEMDIGINVNYLLDVLSVMEQTQVKLAFANATASVLIEEAENSHSAYIIMPMRL